MINLIKKISTPIKKGTYTRIDHILISNHLNINFLF